MKICPIEARFLESNDFVHIESHERSLCVNSQLRVHPPRCDDRRAGVALESSLEVAASRVGKDGMVTINAGIAKGP
jgi:hypothetical protein